MIVLTPDEVVEITGKSRPSAQARVLDAMGIPYRRRPKSKTDPNGTLCVARIHVEGVRPADANIASEPELVFE